ncbi:hypothetical protein F2Q69_00034236 [Brassica cretica]|uniref:Uncharacterized protein n=1 Tax=Brassica cretica TaxID=69181 RepID=A0A8S9SJ81_BRACR|nr:hypothetical protein F2Q69_00034236 [Brassica cretica]
MDKERLCLPKGVSPSFSIGLFCSEEKVNLFVPDAEERSNCVIIASKTGSIADIDVRTAKNTMQVFEGSLALV